MYVLDRQIDRKIVDIYTHIHNHIWQLDKKTEWQIINEYNFLKIKST